MIYYSTMLKNLCIFTLVYHNFFLIGYDVLGNVITDIKV